VLANIVTKSLQSILLCMVLACLAVPQQSLIYIGEAVAAPPKKPVYRPKVTKQKTVKPSQKSNVGKTGKTTKGKSANSSGKKSKTQKQTVRKKKASIKSSTQKKLNKLDAKVKERTNADPMSRTFNVQAYGGWARAAPKDGFTGMPKKIVLMPGKKIDRYGQGGGHFASPKGTKFDKRSLPTGSERLLHQSYQVKKPLPALSGTIAPAFGKPGQGVQYKFSKSIDTLVKEGYLSPVK